jgi:cell division protein FtsB
MLVIDSNVLIFIKKEKKNMKILKLMAIVALVGYGASVLAMNSTDERRVKAQMKRATSPMTAEQKKTFLAELEAEFNACLDKIEELRKAGSLTPEEKKRYEAKMEAVEDVKDAVRANNN